MDKMINDVLPNITFKTSRSGGKGGQNVNKVSSKVEAALDINTPELFTDAEKLLIMEKLCNRITKDGILQVVCQEERSQFLNRQKAIAKLFNLINGALTVAKKRKATKPGKSVNEARLREKQANAKKKIERKWRLDI